MSYIEMRDGFVRTIEEVGEEAFLIKAALSIAAQRTDNQDLEDFLSRVVQKDETRKRIKYILNGFIIQQGPPRWPQRITEPTKAAAGA